MADPMLEWLRAGRVPITAEQVERAIETPRHIDYRALGAGWRHRAPDYVVEAHDSDDWDAEHAALTRWRDELAAAETPDDTAPERLRERREALGWDVECAAFQAGMSATGIKILEDAHYPGRSPTRVDRYAAALSAAEAERAKLYTTTEIDGATPILPDHNPVPVSLADLMPAPEVVDVPQPIVKRCSRPDIHDDVEAEWRPGEPYLTVTHTTIPLALLRAMLEAIDAQHPTRDRMPPGEPKLLDPEPTRPEPRYKVGDWVRVTSVADGGDASCVGVVFRVLSVFVSNGIDIYVSPKHGTWPVEHLTPALDPALHETARRAVAMLHKGEWPLDVPRVEDLPGFDEWKSGGMGSPSWAAQLERLLGDAP